MSDFDELLAQARRDLDPPDEVLDRVTSRLAAERAERAPVVGLGIGQPDVAAVRRVQARLDRRQRRPRWVVPVGVVAVAAAALLSLGGPAEVDQPLVGASTWSELQPTDDVAVAWEGEGHLLGAPDDLELAWEVGTVQVSVTPEQGIDLAVTTAEARVSVVGTAFAVTRDPLGTHVEVQHGRVRVACVEGGETEIGAGERASCLPTTAAGRMGRARMLLATDPGAALVAAEAGLALGATGLVAAELGMVRVEALLALGRGDEAVERARELLAGDPGARRAELEAIAGSTGSSTGSDR